MSSNLNGVGHLLQSGICFNDISEYCVTESLATNNMGHSCKSYYEHMTTHRFPETTSNLKIVFASQSTIYFLLSFHFTLSDVAITFLRNIFSSLLKQSILKDNFLISFK